MEFLINLLGPLHPPLVHFAVACPLLALFALMAQKYFEKPWLGHSAAALWSFAFLAAIAAGISGHLFSLHLGMETQFSILPPESASEGRLREHALLGSLSLLFSFLTLWAAILTFQGKPLSWNVQLCLGLICAILVGLTGHEGGEMVYDSEPAAVSPPSGLESSAPQNFQDSKPGGKTKKFITEKSGDLINQTLDYRKTLVKMNARPWNSRTHGHRWVNTYVSREAVNAYEKSDPLPVGSQVVKESFEDADGKTGAQPGPLYVMVKGPLSASPRTGGWQYALAWEKPVPSNPENILAPVQWLPGDRHLNSCVKCHDHFKLGDYMGGIPEGFEKK